MDQRLVAALQAMTSDPVYQQSELLEQFRTEQRMRQEQGSPEYNAVTGGVVDDPRSGFFGEGPTPQEERAKTQPVKGKGGRRRKGGYSEFFGLLRRMKSEDAEGKKDTRKALQDLAKQLSDQDSAATQGNATGTVSAY